MDGLLQLCEINLWNGSFNRGRLWPFTLSCCLQSDSSNNQLPLDKISSLQVISFFSHSRVEVRTANWFQADYTDCLLGGNLSHPAQTDLGPSPTRWPQFVKTRNGSAQPWISQMGTWSSWLPADCILVVFQHKTRLPSTYMHSAKFSSCKSFTCRGLPVFLCSIDEFLSGL